MAKRSSVIGRRGCRLLRLALLWAQKGGTFSFHKLIKKLAHSRRRPLAYGDRQFSFAETPVVRVKMHRPSSSLLPSFNMPCVQPHFDEEWDDHVQGACDVDDEEEEEEEEGIDVRAEKFIADFYHQMKLQSQISCLE